MREYSAFYLRGRFLMKRYLFVMLGALLFLATGSVGCSAGGSVTGRIEMEDGGVIEFELYPDVAPESVRNFVYLAQQGYYDGLRFHRIIEGFMIQTGCPYSRDFDGRPGTGNPGYSITGEFSANGHANNLRHSRGVMSMARAGDPNSGGSQFFICHADRGHLDGEYAAFGRVTNGMDVVDAIAETPVIGSNGEVDPDDMPVIRRIVINGNVNLPEPNKIPR